MVDRPTKPDFAEGQRRLHEIESRLRSTFGSSGVGNVAGGLVSGLSSLIEQVGKLAEQAEKSGGTLNRSGEFGSGSGDGVKGVYGFTVRTGIGPAGSRPVKVEPFGNLRSDDDKGRVVVAELREPVIDLFDEAHQLLVVAEVPGITAEDVELELHDDILILVAEKGDQRYRKEMLLPSSFTADQMGFTCHNGLLKVTFAKLEKKA
jgi:HSP20 family protein